MSAVGGNKSHVLKLQVPAWVKAKRRKRRRMQEDYSLHVLRTISNKILPTILSRWEDLHMRTCPGSLFIVVYQGKIYSILDCQSKNKDEDRFMLGGRRFVVRLLKWSFFRSKVSPIHLVHFLQNVNTYCIWFQTIAKILVNDIVWGKRIPTRILAGFSYRVEWSKSNAFDFSEFRRYFLGLIRYSDT